MNAVLKEKKNCDVENHHKAFKIILSINDPIA